jgi:hypothetical protein
MGRDAPHGEPRRMYGRDAGGPSPFEARRTARCAAQLTPQGDGDGLVMLDASTPSLRA